MWGNGCTFFVLRNIGLARIEADFQLREILGEFRGEIENLPRELATRANHDVLETREVRVRLLDHGNEITMGLPRSRFALANERLPLQRLRDDPALNRGRILITEFRESPAELGR